MGFFCKAGAVRRGLLPTRCHWNCLKCLEQTTTNSPDFGLLYKHQTWSRFCSSSALAREPCKGIQNCAKFMVWHGLGQKEGKFMKLGIVLGDFVLEEIHLETKRVPGLSHHVAEGSSKTEQGPAKPWVAPLAEWAVPSAGTAPPRSAGDIWLSPDPPLHTKNPRNVERLCSEIFHGCSDVQSMPQKKTPLIITSTI